MEHGPHRSERHPVSTGKTTAGKTQRSGLRRPRRPVSFDLPKHLIASQPTTPTSSVSARNKDVRSRSSTPGIQATAESSLVRLTRTSIILSAIHRRNKNQHRNQRFYKHLSLLRRSISKLLDLHGQLAAQRGPSATAVEARQWFEQESRLRGQCEILEEHVRETIVPAAYVAFSGVVADTQFANLGVVLVGVLADVVGIVGTAKRIEKSTILKSSIPPVNTAIKTAFGSGGRLIGSSTLMTGPDNGIVVERIYDSDEGAVVKNANNNVPRDMVDAGSEFYYDMGEVIQWHPAVSPNEHDRNESMTSTSYPKQAISEPTAADTQTNDGAESSIETPTEHQNVATTTQIAFTVPAHPTPNQQSTSPPIASPDPISQPASPPTNTSKENTSRTPAIPPPDRTIPPNPPSKSKSTPSRSRITATPEQAGNVSRSRELISSKAKETHKKKKKKSNAIDDLFSRLG